MYYPTYEIQPDTDPAIATWLREVDKNCPSKDLIDITDVCAYCKVPALVRNRQGRTVAIVDANGDYEMCGLSEIGLDKT